MIQFDTSNLGKIDPKHGLSGAELKEHADRISDCLKSFEKRGQGFHHVIDDDSIVQKICTYCDSVQGKYDDIAVLGIGGSALGALCLKQSLTHLFEHEQKPKLHVLDNIDPAFLSDFEDVIDYKKTLFLVVSKSGETPETLAEYFYFRKRCEEKDLSVKDHFVFVTDAKKGYLRNIADKEGIQTFEIPENVGGRFSAFTVVGLLPAKLIGIDIEAFLKGAKEMRDRFLSTNFAQNLPYQIANIQYLLHEKGKRINVLFPYSHKLIRFADWYRQLLAESIGKKADVGITPVSGLGVTDQHSQNQLYNAGPNDKFFMFIEVKNHGKKIMIPSMTDMFPEGTTFEKLMHLEMQGTVQSLTQNNRPNVTLTIDEVNEEHLGGLIMLFAGATVFLAELFGINAFDQPGVELSKKLTKELLLRK